MDQSPVFLQPEHGIPGAAEGNRVFFQQSVHELLQGFDIGSAAEQTGIGHKGPSDHHSFYRGNFLGQGFNLFQRSNVSVVAQRIFAVFSGISEHLPIDTAVIKLLPHPGMDGQLLDGIFVIDIQNSGKLVRILDAQSGLDGNRQNGMLKNFIQETVQMIGVPEHTASFALGHHGAGGTARI